MTTAFKSLCSAALFAAAASVATAGSIDPAKLSAHIKVLASDAFEGRGPGTPAEAKTIAYIADQFRAEGLSPAGNGGGWTQAVTLRSFHPVGEVRTSVTVAGQVRPLKWLTIS